MLIGRIPGFYHSALTSVFLLLICLLISDISMAEARDGIKLPKAHVSGALEQALSERRSVRNFHSKKLSLPELSQLLWAAQGITDTQGYRAAPSAGALYPLELYIVSGSVETLLPAVYHYDPYTHTLILVSKGDQRVALATAAMSQTWIAEAAAVVVFSARYSRTTIKYGERGRRYVHIEVGHAAENLFLQAQALGLSTVVVGAFDDQQVSGLAGLPDGFEPLLLMPVGHRKTDD